MRCKASPATPQEGDSLSKEFIFGSTNPDPPVVKSALSSLPLKKPGLLYQLQLWGKVHKFQHSLRVKGVSATTANWQIVTEIIIP